MWRWIFKHEVLIFILAGVILLRIPTLLEPYWYGDEGIYLTIGHGLRMGRELYAQIHDNKPPFLYLIAAIANGSQFWFRLITLFWTTATVAIFWFLSRKWFNDPEPSIWATIIFALLTSIPFLEGNIANAELFFLLATVGAFYWLYKGRSPFWGGILLGLGALFKVPAVLEVAIWPLFWFATKEKGWFKKSLSVGIGALLPLAVSGLYFATRGTLNQYLIATGLQNIPYLSSWAAPVSLSVRAAAAAILILALFIVRKHLSHRALLLGFAGVITLFAALLSGRPYPHYLLQMVPIVCLGVGTVIWGKERERLIFAALTALTTSALIIFHFYFYPVKSYYANFFKFATHRITKSEYLAHFSADVLANYEIAETIALGSLPTDQIFVWGDQPMIYALAKRLPVGKYTVRYHIADFHAQDETMMALEASPPRYIVDFGNHDEMVGLTSLISRRYIHISKTGGADIYRRFDSQAIIRQ